MSKYSKKLLNRVEEHNVKKILNETDDFTVIQKELIKIGLGDFVPSINDECKHELIFKESLPRDSKWFCRYCFTEIDITQYRERDA